MATSRFVEITDKEIAKLKPKNTLKILKQLFASVSEIIGE
jgi:hypothetical protein